MLKETEVTGHNYQMVEIIFKVQIEYTKGNKKIRQPRDTGRWQTKEKTYYYAKTNTNKTWALIQTTGGKDERPSFLYIATVNHIQD
jgi:hypothetical protein